MQAQVHDAMMTSDPNDVPAEPAHFGLPEAPLAMPKQVLERRGGLLARTWHHLVPSGPFGRLMLGR